MESIAAVIESDTGIGSSDSKLVAVKDEGRGHYGPTAHWEEVLLVGPGAAMPDAVNSSLLSPVEIAEQPEVGTARTRPCALPHHSEH